MHYKTEYLGNCVKATFLPSTPTRSALIELTATDTNGNDTIYLDPFVWTALCNFAERFGMPRVTTK